MRGIEGVRAEFNIVCAAMNIKRIWAYLQNKKREIRAAILQSMQMLYSPIDYPFYLKPLHMLFV